MKRKDIRLYMPGWIFSLIPLIRGIWAVPAVFLAASTVLLIYAQLRKLEQPERLWHRSILPILGFGYLSQILGGEVKTLFMLLMASVSNRPPG